MSHHQAEPNSAINREPLYNFENTNHNVSALSQIAENVSTLLQKAEEHNPSNSFEDNFSNFDNGSHINSDDYDKEYTNLFIKPEDDKNKTESKDFDNFYNDAFKDELNLFTPTKRESQKPPIKKEFFSEEKPLKLSERSEHLKAYSDQKPLKNSSERNEYLKAHSEQKKPIGVNW